MKRFLMIVVAVCATCLLWAQSAQHSSAAGKMRIAQQANAYVERFALQGEQAEQFTTLYREYNKALHAIKTQYAQPTDQAATASTDEQVEKRILDGIAQSRAILDVRERYYHLFRTILTPSQVRHIFEDEKARREHVQKPAA